MTKYTGSLDLSAVEAALIQTNGNKQKAADLMGVPVTTFKDAAKFINKAVIHAVTEDLQIKTNDDACIVTCRSKTIKTLEDALVAGNVDTTVWEVDHWVLNKWDCVSKTNLTEAASLTATELWQVKVWLRRKQPEVQALENLLYELKNHKLKLPVANHRKCKQSPRELEISIVDPHLGMIGFEPEADAIWNIDKCEQIVLDMVEELIQSSQYYAPFSQIVFPFGNDFLHADNMFGTTTKGTPLPDATSWHQTILRGEKLVFAIIERLRQEAPVKVIVIPGNHDKHSTFMLGRVVDAYYHNTSGVEVVCNASPYKFHKFGVNLIGYIHGNAFPVNRLAALMANETRTNGWAEARYCEWHLGDQHRKGTSRPLVMEEQGVSVEYLPGLTPPNEWHKMNAFNWQKRAGMAFVWDKTRGPVARLQVNIDNYTGEFLGQ